MQAFDNRLVISTVFLKEGDNVLDSAKDAVSFSPLAVCT
jgi:hypothetical protein